MPLTNYGEASAYQLLASAARGHIAFDQRLIGALTADPARTLPDLIRFSREDRGKDLVDIAPDLLYLFALMPTPEAVPFLISEMKREPDDAGHDLIELANKLGSPAADALLDLFDETGRAHSEILFVAMMAGARGPRVDAALDVVGEDAAFLREIAESPYEVDPAPPQMEYPAEAHPDLSALPEAEREEFLLSDAAEFRLMAIASYFGEDVTDRRRQQFMEMGANDPDPAVRGLAWEVLREDTDKAPILKAMTSRLGVAKDPIERAGLASALAYHLEVPGVVEAIEAAYAEPTLRARALEAMWRSLDRRWVDRPAQNLGDPDLNVRRQAVIGIGYFQLGSDVNRLEPLMRDPDLREDAIYAYALAAPAEASRFGLQQLETRIEELAGGLGEEEEELLHEAFDTRLAMAPAPAVSVKVGRNDPCPCGSGKKYKKCCGAS